MCAPDAPDYRAAAVEQGQSGKENLATQTWANRPTQQTPWGSTSWQTGATMDPGTNTPVTTWTQNQTLNPQLQKALDDQLAITAGRSGAAGTLLGQATGAFQKPIDWQGLPQQGTFGNAGYGGPDLKSQLYQPGQIGQANFSPEQMGQSAYRGQQVGPSGYGGEMVGNQGYQADQLGSSGYQADTLGRQSFDAGGARDRAEQALFQRQKNMIEPGLTQSEAARRTRLANMGIAPEGGSEAWNRAQTGMDTARNQAYENASLNAITGGGAEATREMQLAQGQQGMDINRGQYNLGQAQGAQGLDIARGQYNLGQAQGAQGLDIGRTQANLAQAQGLQGMDVSRAASNLAQAQGVQGMDINRGTYNAQQAQAGQGLDIGREQANLALAQGAQGLDTTRLNQAQTYTDAQSRQRQQAIAEAQLQRNQPLNELNALLTGQQVQNPQMPTFSPAGVAPATNYLGAAQMQGGDAGGGSGIGTLLGGVAGSFFGPMGTAAGSAIGGQLFGGGQR